MNVFHLSLAALMVVTGSINTLSVKWADKLDSPSADGKVRPFNHPFLQSCGMFLGEMLCMVAFVIVRWRRRRIRQQSIQPRPDPILDAPAFNPLIFLPPALCDMTATSIQYIGLTLTYASSFQMLRGAVIVFTGILSMIVLRRKLLWFKWLGIVFVIVGLSVVGVCDILYTGGGSSPNATDLMVDTSDNRTSSDILLGDVLIICAQVIVATQMVYEEKFVAKYSVPALQAVGYEGTFGFLAMSALLIPMYFIHVGPKWGNNPREVLEDAYDGLYQLTHNPLLSFAFCTTIVSIAFFNFAGISVTKEMSATTRMVLDSVRTLVIWAVSIGVGWQTFHGLQLLGFAVLLLGMCVYNNILFMPLGRYLYTRWMSRYRNLEEDSLADDQASPGNVYQPNFNRRTDGPASQQ